MTRDGSLQFVQGHRHGRTLIGVMMSPVLIPARSAGPLLFTAETRAPCPPVLPTWAPRAARPELATERPRRCSTDGEDGTRGLAALRHAGAGGRVRPAPHSACGLGNSWSSARDARLGCCLRSRPARWDATGCGAPGRCSGSDDHLRNRNADRPDRRVGRRDTSWSPWTPLGRRPGGNGDRGWGRCEPTPCLALRGCARRVVARSRGDRCSRVAKALIQ